MSNLGGRATQVLFVGVHFAFGFQTVKAFSISCALLVSCSVSLQAGEHIYCKSPDGKFALRETFTDLQPSHGDATIIETGTHKVALQLNGDEPTADLKLVWSKDSWRVASFRNDAHGGLTRVFFRNGSAFDEIKLPELPSPQLPDIPKPDAANSETMKRLEPIRWLETRDLVLESELQNKAGARAAYEIILGFRQDNRPVIRKSEQQKMSIVDYFLLLPSDTFEGPPGGWLYVMRANGEVIDKANGYMSCPGDGAQPEFEVALFRHRDGRPLLALCSGELEGADSVDLRFFEMGADNKMHEIKHSMLPGAEREYDPDLGEGKGKWQFVLPRQGRTIVVRAQKSKKTLRRVIWDGEKFQEEK